MPVPSGLLRDEKSAAIHTTVLYGAVPSPPNPLKCNSGFCPNDYVIPSFEFNSLGFKRLASLHLYILLIWGNFDILVLQKSFFFFLPILSCFLSVTQITHLLNFWYCSTHQWHFLNIIFVLSTSNWIISIAPPSSSILLPSFISNLLVFIMQRMYIFLL